jgi:hypothetical protein
MSGNARTDDQLMAMLDETAPWTVNGPSGEVIVMAGSLREAIGIALTMDAAGKRVIGVARRPEDSVIVFYGQLERLAQTL